MALAIAGLLVCGAAVPPEIYARRIDAERTAETVTGRIIEIRTITVRDRKNVLIVLDSNGRNRLVEVGPAKNLPVVLTLQTELSVQGVYRKVSNSRVLVATHIQYNNQVYSIDRRIRDR
jgi:hypothetical protein